MERLLPDELFTGKVGEAVTFSAAANERENRQLLILPYGGNNLTGVAVKLPETLVDESGKAVPFTFRISRIEYARLPKPSPFMYPLERIPDKLIEAGSFDIPATHWRRCGGALRSRRNAGRRLSRRDLHRRNGSAPLELRSR